MAENGNGNNRWNGFFTKAWRVTIMILLGVLAFLGTNLYSKVYDHIPETYVRKDRFVELKADIRGLQATVDQNNRDLLKKIDEINCYLRDHDKKTQQNFNFRKKGNTDNE